MALVNANFRVWRVPLVWFPYASASAGSKVRAVWFSDSGYRRQFAERFYFWGRFLLGAETLAGRHAGAQYLSRRGVAATRGELRAKPFEGTSINYTYLEWMIADYWSMACGSRRAASSRDWS